MSIASKIALLKEMLDSAESSLRSAKQVVNEISKNPSQASQYSKMAKTLPATENSDDGDKIVEGIFDGQSMIGPDKKTYPVPANYASKSKLVPGDVLKLTIMPDGSFIYKQIGPVERRRIIGPLTYEEGQYRVLAEGKAYKVLLASVTYFRAEVGDKIAILVPEYEESDWSAIENVLPKGEDEESEDLFSLLKEEEEEKAEPKKTKATKTKKAKTTSKKKKS